MDIGVVSRSFPELENREAARVMSQNGFRWTELCFSCRDSKYWVYNGRSDISSLTNNKARSIVNLYRNGGIEIVALGVFTNLIDPDTDQRGKNLEYFKRHMQIAADNGILHVSTECGFIPGRRGIFADTYEEDFERLKDSFQYLANEAERYNIYIAFEPCVIDVVPSAKRTSDFLTQVGSPRIKVLLDPANLIANSSEEDMFSYLGKDIAYFHGKDRKVNDKMGRALGEGDIDWPLFFKLYNTHTRGYPFVLEYVKQDNLLKIKDTADKAYEASLLL